MKYFIPIFIVLYVFIASLGRLGTFNDVNEFYPFFGFDLYSMVPNDINKYDLQFNRGTENESFLLLRDIGLNRLEKKYCRRKIREMMKDHQNSNVIDSTFLKIFTSKHQTVHLVKLTGNYRDLVRYNKFQLEVIRKIK